MYSQVIVIGTLISLFYTELSGYSAGLIIPGYFALNAQNPLRMLYTLLCAAVAVLLCRLLAGVTILYGRRRFAVLMLLTLGISALVKALGFSLPMIGIILPGLLARELDRQGFIPTLLSLAVTTGATLLCVLLLGV